MRRLATIASAIFVAATVASAASAAVPGGYTLFGGATLDDGKVTLVSNATVPASGIAFELEPGTTVSDIDSLSAVLVSAACGGGSPRFQINTAEGNIFVYLGTAPNFTACATGDTGNLLATADLRVDTSQVGGTFYDTWAHAVALVGDELVTELLFVVDSGWLLGSQTVVVESVTIDGTLIEFDAPGSKEMCKNGGWRDFGGFKNQGDCVSFIATGGRNAPAGD
jgi:hypothetical protein